MKHRDSFAVAWLACVATACAGEPLVDDMFTEAEWMLVQTLSPLPALPPSPTNAYADDAAAAALGHALFFETSYAGPVRVGPEYESDDQGEAINGALGVVGERGKIACSSCHNADTGWFFDARSRPGNTSLAAGWGHRNTPSAVNVAFYRWFGWSGENDALWKQSLGTTESAVSMNSSRLAIAHMLHDRYADEYEAIFGPIDPRFDPAHPDAGDFPPEGKPGDEAFDRMPAADQTVVNRMFANFGKAIAAYERLLVSRDAPFDRYVAGDRDAIGVAARRGLQLFIGKAGCVDCHNTPTFSDGRFHNIGVPQEGPYAPEEDPGRYEAVGGLLVDPFNGSGMFSDDPDTGKLDDLVQAPWQMGRFRTAQLRHVAETPPYMHTGAYSTLEQVIEHYDDGGDPGGYAGVQSDRIQPLNLSPREIADLLAFLETLTGEPVDEALQRAPARP